MRVRCVGWRAGDLLGGVSGDVSDFVWGGVLVGVFCMMVSGDALGGAWGGVLDVVGGGLGEVWCELVGRTLGRTVGRMLGGALDGTWGDDTGGEHGATGQWMHLCGTVWRAGVLGRPWHAGKY